MAAKAAMHMEEARARRARRATPRARALAERSETRQAARA